MVKDKIIVLKFSDVEECNMVIHSLRNLPKISNNVNTEKLNSLIGTIEVIRHSLSK